MENQNSDPKQHHSLAPTDAELRAILLTQEYLLRVYRVLDARDDICREAFFADVERAAILLELIVTERMRPVERSLACTSTPH